VGTPRSAARISAHTHAPQVKKPKVPGDKIARLKPMDVDEMLGELVRNQLVNTPRKIKLDELIGDNAYAPTGRVIVPPKVEEAKDPDPPYVLLLLLVLRVRAAACRCYYYPACCCCSAAAAAYVLTHHNPPHLALSGTGGPAACP